MACGNLIFGQLWKLGGVSMALRWKGGLHGVT